MVFRVTIQQINIVIACKLLWIKLCAKCYYKIWILTLVCECFSEWIGSDWERLFFSIPLILSSASLFKSELPILTWLYLWLQYSFSILYQSILESTVCALNWFPHVMLSIIINNNNNKPLQLLSTRDPCSALYFPLTPGALGKPSVIPNSVIWQIGAVMPSDMYSVCSLRGHTSVMCFAGCSSGWIWV